LIALPSIALAVLIPTQGPTYIKILPDDDIQLLATLTPVGSAPVAYGFYWSSTSVNISAGAPGLLSSPASLLLMLQRGLLPGGNTYLFSFIVFSLADSKITSRYNVSVEVNAAPSSGSCSISPQTGVAMTTYFDILCKNWLAGSPSDLPFRYQASALAADNTTVQSVIIDFQLGGLFQVLLPAGLDANLKPIPLIVRVVIRNRWGATTRVPLTVMVTNPDVSSPSAVAAVGATALNGQLLAQQAGNLDASGQFVGPLSQSLLVAASAPGGNSR
jgi:hypothetical protein